MAKKKINSDFEDMKMEDEFEFDFDEADFDDEDGHKKKSGRKKKTGHIIFFVVVAIIIALCGWKLYLWNQGQTIEIDPNEDTSEFDTEPNDYIQPMTNEQLAGKIDDGVLTILTLGNSGFADDGGKNVLANAFASELNANVINASIPDSMQSRQNGLGDDSNPVDGISLYNVVDALVKQDTASLIPYAEQVSGYAYNKAVELSEKNIDMSTVDCVVIFYDLTDYIEKRNIYNPDDDDDVATYCGALSASIKTIQANYPYIRIVVMSPPACGITVDDYYVDATTIDLSNGTLNDYIGNEVGTCATTGVSFIDLYFGVINVDTRDKYLVNDYHINEAGAKAIVARFNKLIALE